MINVPQRENFPESCVLSGVSGIGEGKFLIDPACAVHEHIFCHSSVACPVGTSYDQKSSKCELCGKGTYQDKEGQASCIECDGGKSTDSLGTVSSEDCVKG